MPKNQGETAVSHGMNFSGIVDNLLSLIKRLWLALDTFALFLLNY